MFSHHEPELIDIQDIKAIKQCLTKDGYAVVHVPSIDIDHLKDLFSSDMAEITGEKVDFPELWDSYNKIPHSSMPGLMGEYGLSQGNAAWYVRTNSDIIQLYKHLLEAERVVCSMDAVGFSQDGANLDISDRLWLHVDQNPNCHGAELNSIQGIFYAEDSKCSRAGTVVVPGSHKHWNKHIYTSGSHFQIIDQQYVSGAVKLDIPAGHLLLFSSKLAHQGMYGPHRLCFMICYGDVKDRTEEVRQRKVVMYLGGHRSTHWSQFGKYHGWKWEHGESWNVLAPKTTKYSEDQINMLEDEITDPACYEPEMDGLVPAERLALL